MYLYNQTSQSPHNKLSVTGDNSLSQEVIIYRESTGY